MGDLIRLKYSHEAMIDQMIANPVISVRELALRFGVTEGWVYRIRSSSVFREKLRERTREMVDPHLAAEIEERFDSLVNRSLEVLMDKLSKDSEAVPDELAMQAATLGAKARGFGGFGAKVAPPPAPRDPGWLERSAERLRNLNNPQGVVDVESREVLPQAREAGAR